jgi:hypothetical protein
MNIFYLFIFIFERQTILLISGESTRDILPTPVGKVHIPNREQPNQRHHL